jgi:hypothetical protein
VKVPPVEVVKDPKSGVEVTIFYDRERFEFYALIPTLNERIADKDGATCTRKVREALVRTRAFEWRPIITIEHGGGESRSHRTVGSLGGGGAYDSDGARLAFSYWRAELAPKPGAPRSFLERPHLEDIEHKGDPWLVSDPDVARSLVERARKDRDTGVDVHDHYPREGQVVIDFTPEAWAALARLKAATLATYAQLVELFGQPKLLAAVCPAPMLAASTERKDDE